MFDSGVMLKSLVEETRNEADIYMDIPDEYFVRWINAVEQLLYTEIIKQELMCEATISDIMGESGEISRFGKKAVEVVRPRDIISSTDIYRIFRGDGLELMKVNPVGIFTFSRPAWCVGDGDKLLIKGCSKLDTLAFFFFERPKPPAESMESMESMESTVKVPAEHLEFVKAKLRAEMYSLANDDVLSAKWFNVYNAGLSDFISWIGGRDPLAKASGGSAL